MTTIEDPMSYEVRCECGKAYPVGAADAGVSFPCACGREVEVPPFHLLRTARGGGAVHPLARVRAGVSSGVLPGTRACASCGAESNGRCRVKIVCERTPNNSGPSEAERAAGCLIGPLIAVLLRAGREQEGDEEAVIVSVPVCDACRPKLGTTSGLRSALRRIPDYAALLDRYPKATLECLS